MAIKCDKFPSINFESDVQLTLQLKLKFSVFERVNDKFHHKLYAMNSLINLGFNLK